ncbi:MULTISPECIES: TetR/AcrR family transcriptional regulator [Rhodobacterales]|uniref:TetR family transcriptional regulator n=2 Tax=Rhodobacterales TaxID=204455 RepID=A0A2T5H4V5_9RHOB|nr:MULTISPECIES: TetR/AcrR family transcriptional regulator [Rhodobacterales]MDK3020413.1 TetR/AcrR family transcriptional regulator [Pseudodonghicola flavimaris]PTQ66621.1 TetR family transcriptional regulator [Celeribacter persicus]TNE59204.1 MAG: TetR/AcrR family transcriptional regulator [Sphingomonadales bacterium]
MGSRPPRGEGVTRRKILEAAIKRFGEHSYEETSLRDIAGDVGVDVAYAHRSFGSKKMLFIEALEASSERLDLSVLEPDKIAIYLVERLLAEPRGRVLPNISAFDILIHSVHSAQLSPLLKERFESLFLRPLSSKFEGVAEERIYVVISLLLGFGILRDFLKPPTVTALGRDKVTAMLTCLIHQILSESPLLQRGNNPD